MKTVIVTGSCGLVGAESVRQFAALGYRVIGIDNDMRAQFFGPDGSTLSSRLALRREVDEYQHWSQDIRSWAGVAGIFSTHGDEIAAVIHTAAQPSHDWAARKPHIDFDVNANGTLNLLEATRLYCPGAAFVFTSTNKVYGDATNKFEYREGETRFEPHLWSTQEFYTEGVSEAGFSETLSIDHCTHSLFGVSKLAADVLVQEYGRYFGMNTVCFRGGCLTGPGHAGVPQHGFLSYLVKCAMTGTPYTIIGHGGKQVRDNIHASDLVRAFVEYVNNPKPGAVYNIGGGPERSCSVMEAIVWVQVCTKREITFDYEETPRVGDHKWWVTDTRKFEADYPNWSQRYSLTDTIREIADAHSKSEAA